MYPILITIGGIDIHTYGAMGALGFLAVAFLALRRAEAIGVNRNRTVDLIFYTSIVALVGARVIYILQNPDQFDGPASWINIRRGGLVFYGAMIFGLPFASLLMRAFKVPYFAMWDVFATGMPLGHALSRIGCLGAGCCYGAPAPEGAPYAIIFPPDGGIAPAGTPLHATQIYEATALFIIAGAVNLFYSRKAFDGQVMLLYLMLYAGARSTIEVFRGDSTRGYFVESVFGDALSYSQGVSLCVALLALVVFLVGPMLFKSPPTTTTEA